MEDKRIYFTTERLIHRLQFTIHSRLEKQILPRLETSFQQIAPKKKDNSFIRRFIFGDSKIRYKTYDKQHHTHSIIISNATEEIQKIFLEIIFDGLQRRTITKQTITLNEAEFTLDIELADNKHMKHLPKIIHKHGHPKGSRGIGEGKYETTHYLASHGDVHDGSKGIRHYPRQKRGRDIYRIEAQLNADFIEYHFPEEYRNFTKPIPQDYFDPFSIIEYRKINLKKTMEAIKRNSKWKDKPANSIGWRLTQALLEAKLFDPNAYDKLHIKRRTSTAKQIGIFKEKIAPRYGLEKRMDRCFPICSKQKIMKAAISRGYFLASEFDHKI